MKTTQAQPMADKNHALYYSFINNPNSDYIPKLEEIQAYLSDAYQGFVPLPLSAENLSKSYAFFAGSCHKETLEKILSDESIAFSLIPGLKDAVNIQTFDLVGFKNSICIKREVKDLKKLKHLIGLYNQRSIQSLSSIYSNPQIVISALKSISKKQWGSQLAKPPTNKNLLIATSKLSSEEFFAKGMHLAFLEIEPEIYGTFNKNAADHPHKGFYAKKYLRILLDLEETHKKLVEKEKDRLQAEASARQSAEIAQPVRTAPVHKPLPPEVRTKTRKSIDLNEKSIDLEAPKDRPSFVERLLREELGYKQPVGKDQALRILQATSDILKNAMPQPPKDFLHSKHPSPKKEVITFETMDLSKRSI